MQHPWKVDGCCGRVGQFPHCASAKSRDELLEAALEGAVGTELGKMAEGLRALGAGAAVKFSVPPNYPSEPSSPFI